MEMKPKNKRKIKPGQIWFVVLILVMIVGIYIIKNDDVIANEKSKVAQQQTKTASTEKLPRLVDLGAGTCIPCQQMAPILEELKAEYAGRVIVDVIDVNENQQEAYNFNISVIPTQILLDANGKEVSRHEGFIPKEDLIKLFELVGVK